MNASLEQDVMHVTAQQVQMAMLTRLGRPPLRFKGQRIAHHSTADDALFVDLWARKKGDFVVAYTDVHKAAADAAIFPDPDAAATFLEDRCDCHPEPPSATDIDTLIKVLIQQRVHQRHFAVLVGEALAEWDSQGILHSSAASERKFNYANG